ncbi:PAC2 family protein [Kocuria sp. p3-SID1433]|uniref:PAC2 family protein n=1 Tax=unclassified Kocuria TaxID=2649579 RepID=UPI0021A7294D|nr:MULTISPECIES: PAC2 family protein [unclassified Kocuria]MCT1602738.1 PAC2 family protein [Kocuria sp. p3-SID1428]MCT2180646.1 PAC2 family protein [Kocuria sp. p3-SID1433]
MSGFDETFPQPEAGPFGVVQEAGSSERVRVLIGAFEGWNDAGDAATDAVKLLAEAFGAVEDFEISPDDYYDYQYSRPRIVRSAAGESKIVWPTTRMLRASVPGTNLDLILLHGWEPSYRWSSFAAEILEHAARLEVDFVVMVGALLADVPHSRPIPLTVTSEIEELQQELEITGSDYDGPTGMVGVLGHLAAVSGIPSLSLWAAVPHYVAQSPSPKAQLAVLRRLEDLLRITVPMDALVEDAEAWERGVDDLAEEDPEIAAYVAKLEEAKDTADLPEASGDAIAQEFERFLRRRDQN